MLIAIDPGQNTGMAFRFDNDEWATLTAEKVPVADDRLAMVIGTVKDYADQGKVDTIVIENFKTMGYLSRYGIETIELVGAIKGLCFTWSINLVRQDPSHRKPFERTAQDMLRTRAKQLKLSPTDHEVSALSHLLRYEYNQQTSTARSADASSTTPSESTSGTSPLTGGPIAFAVKPVRRSVQGGHDK